MSAARLRAPREHLELLVEPALGDIERHLRSPRPVNVEWLGEPIESIRARWLAETGLAAPVLSTGHQAEFFHAGVFAKTIALDWLSQRCGATPLFVCVDSDLGKSNSLAFPRRGNDGYTRSSISVPGLHERVAMEHQSPIDAALVETMLAKVAREAALPVDSVLPVFSDALRTAADGGALDWVTGLLAGQTACEAALGLQPARALRVSQLCESTAFKIFVARFVIDARLVAEAYNAAVADARRGDHAREASRVAVPLRVGPDRVEVPFWMIRRDLPRQRMFVRGVGSEQSDFELFADDRAVVRLPAASLRSAASAADALSRLPDGWSIRPRALTLSAFLRVFVADVFIHGLGGLEYDRATEAFMQSALRVRLRPMACVTASMHLLPDELAAPGAAERVPTSLHELHCNPHVWLPSAPADLVKMRRSAVDRVVQLRRSQPHDHIARRAAFLRVRALNAAIRDAARDEEAQVESLMREQRARSESRRWLKDRGWFYAFHSQRALQALVAKVRVQAPVGNRG